MKLKYFIYLVFFCNKFSYSQNSVINIENEEFLIEIKRIDTLNNSASSFSVVKFGNNINAKNITIGDFFLEILPIENIIKANNLPKDKFNFNIIAFKNIDNLQEKLIRILANQFNFSFEIEEENSHYYEIKTENFSLLNEVSPESLEGIDSIMENDSLLAFVKVEDLAKILFNKTKKEHNYKGYLIDKYFFSIDFNNLDKSLNMNGLTRIENKKMIKVFRIERN